jgi:hypothetical protein
VTYTLTLEIPRLPHLQAANARQHWAVRRREEQWWKHQVGWHARGKGLPEEPMKRAWIACVRLSASEPDHDNLVASFKPAIDGLKGLVIEDDSPECVTVWYGWEPAKRNQGGVRIGVSQPGVCPDCKAREGINVHSLWCKVWPQLPHP